MNDTEKLAQMMIRCGLATGHGDTIDDLIFELEKQIKNTSHAFSDARAMMAMHDHLYKTEIAQLREALQSISNNTCCDNCQEAALVARAALKEKE